MSENLQTGEVTVDYVSTHTGHKPSVEECKHIPLPPSLRKEVQEKFAAGVTIERIMDGECMVITLSIMFVHSSCNFRYSI